MTIAAPATKAMTGKLVFGNHSAGLPDVLWGVSSANFGISSSYKVPLVGGLGRLSPTKHALFPFISSFSSRKSRKYPYNVQTYESAPALESARGGFLLVHGLEAQDSYR